MSQPDTAEWLARGRTHQQEGRPLDAMICFRRAARAAPGAPDPRYHLGEVLWQLGRPAEARIAWREAAALAPGHVPARQALAEASVATGHLAEAGEAAAAVLTTRPRDPRSRFIAALVALDADRDRDVAAQTLAELLPKQPELLDAPYIAPALARALAPMPPSPARVALHATLVPLADRLPPSLLALIAADVPEPVLGRAVSERTLAVDELEGLRDLALALAASGRQALAREGARRYSTEALAAFGAPTPVLWPRRSAGSALRLALLVATAVPAGIALARELLLRLSRETIELTVLVAGDDAEVRAALAATSFARAPFAVLPERPDHASALAIAARDADVLLDLAGLAWACGGLLAQRPARKLWTWSGLPLAAVPPLVDRVLSGAAEVLATELGAVRVALAGEPAIAASAADMAMLWDAAVEAHGKREFDAARRGYAQVLELEPEHAQAHYLIGVLARDTRDLDEAALRFDTALALSPRDDAVRVAAAQLALARYDPRRAQELARAGLEHSPRHAGLLRALGHAELALRDGQEAVNAFAAALSVEPLDGETHYNYGVALQLAQHRAEAARAYQRALVLRPDLVDAHFNLAIIFDREGETDAAVQALEHVLQRQPTRADAHRTLLDVLAAANRGDDWLRAFRRFEARCPKALGLVANALEAYQYQGDFATVDAYLQRLERDEFKPASELDLVDSLEQLLYLTLFFDLDPAARFSLYTTYDRAARHVYGEPLPALPTRRPGKLRIGYLSADLRNHVMGKMIYEAARHHDRERFDIAWYSTAAEEDAVTARFRALPDRYVTLADVPDAEAVRRIAAEDLDLLVDMSTHTKGARPGILARKPARVQLTHVASAGALGLSAIDFKLTDRYADLPASADYHVEALLPMAGCVYPYRHVEPAAEHPFHRAALGIAADAFVVGAFVSPLKLSRRTLALWKEVLERVPRAVLAFSPTAPWLRPIYPRLLKAAGIDEARVVLLPQGRDDAENQARYTLVDIVLDPMPFGGVNGVIEPLDMVVPVVALCGRAHGERSAYTILANLGVTATVAQTGREYVDIAVRLADDPAFMADVRAQIRAGLAHSPLTDLPAHARNLEAAYLSALAAKAPDALAAAGVVVR
jgi:protein O-GlcNAc transferase